MDLDEGKYALKIEGQGAEGKVQIDIEEHTDIELEKEE